MTNETKRKQGHVALFSTMECQIGNVVVGVLSFKSIG